MTSILIVDDDINLVEGLRWYLEAEQYRVLTASDGLNALAVFRAERPDLVILDIMMPGLDGLRVCETISAESDAMILMLSARDGDIDKVRALTIGADDYVTKPFHVSELVARIQALLRRRRRSLAPAPTWRWRNLAVSREEHRARVDDEEVDLSAMEFNLLTTLMEHPQEVLSRERLVQAVWGDDFVGELRLVDNLVFRLREKLNTAGCADFPIVTIRGVGYAFRPEG